MAKLPRVFQNLFGLNGNQSHYGQFGSRAAGSPILTKDPSVIQALTAFVRNGWLDAINLSNKAPFLEDMNGLFYLAFYQIKYTLQEGIPEWDNTTEYFVGSIVKKTGTFELYGSVTNGNTGNALPSQVSNGFWQYLNPPSVAAGIISDFGGTTPPDGYLLCDGSVYAQSSYSALFTAIGSTWNTGGEGGGNFRVPDLRGRASIGAGTGSGLTARVVGQQAIGEETHTLTIPEMPSHGHGVTDPQHTHPAAVAVDNGLAPGDLKYGILGTNFINVRATGTGYLSRDNVGNAATGISIQANGGGGPHNNMQPSGVVTKIIKF